MFDSIFKKYLYFRDCLSKHHLEIILRRTWAVLVKNSELSVNKHKLPDNRLPNDRPSERALSRLVKGKSFQNIELGEIQFVFYLLFYVCTYCWSLQDQRSHIVSVAKTVVDFRPTIHSIAPLRPNYWLYILDIVRIKRFRQTSSNYAIGSIYWWWPFEMSIT